VSDVKDRVHPRPHQLAAIAAITRALTVGNRTQLVSACGTGKTLIGRWYAQASEARVIAVFVPSLALVAQALAEWRKDGAAQWPYEALVVCSDQSTAAGAAERAAEEGGTVDRGFWARVRAGVTTDPSRAAAALTRAAHPTTGSRIVIFSTYHSAPVVAAALAASGTTLDLLIADEAHRLAGRPRDSFRMVLDDSHIPARKRLFMTATPQLSDGEDVLSMDDEAVFGPRAHTITFASAIQARLLTDYQVLVIADNRVQDGRARRGDYDPAMVPGAVLAAASSHHLRSLLSFHTYVADARAFAGLLDGITLRNGRRVRGRHVSARHRGEQRAKTLGWLGEGTGGRELRLVASARCLAEGVDVPAVDGVLFADPRNAVIGIIQAVGRALRCAPGKTIATIIVPVTLPETGADDDDTDLSVSEFGHVWDVLRALKAHDERFAAEIEAAAETLRRGGTSERGGARHHLHRVRFLLPDGISLDEDLLRLRLVEAVGSDYAWERFHRLLCDYAETTGGAFLPFNKTWNGANLGQWVHRQVAVYKAGRMRADRMAKLQAVPGWVWDREDGHFAENLRRFRDLAASRPGGLTQPPGGPSIYHGLKDSHRLPLGHRAAEYRQLYRDGMLPDEQAQRLEELPGWDWSGGLPSDDVAMIQALREFCEFAHHADVPETHTEGRLPLGRWVYAVRRRKLTGRLHPTLAEEIAAATPRGAKGAPTFRWLHNETQWRLAYSALRQFVKREGHARVPAFHIEQLPDASVQLGQWCGLQRFRKRRDQLDPQYVLWLNALEGWEWNPAGRRQEYGIRLDLGDDKWHGRAKGIAAGCHCEDCVEARRAADRSANERRAQERMRTLGGAMPAGPARRHLAKLEQAAAKRGLLADLTGVPLGIIRQVANGDTDFIARQHDAAIRVITVDMVKSAPTRAGSRGRAVSIGGERIPIGPTKTLIADLQSRGFGMSWITRELGYATTQFLGPDSSMVTRRVADQVADLHTRVGDLVAPARGPTQKVPRLAALLAACRQRQLAG
jgi:superfamily II DNA or RNA helicase